MATKKLTKKPVKAATKPKSVKTSSLNAKKPAPKTAKPAVQRGKVVSIKPKLAAKTAAKQAAKAVAPKLVSKSSLKAESARLRAEYKLGDVLFYPRQGLCKYESTVHEYEIEFVQLRPLNPQMSHATIRVPVGNVEKVGLRRPSQTMTFDAACAYLRKLPNLFEADWRKRNAALTEQTMRGHTTDLLAAAKTFALQDAIKPLSHQERRQYEQIVQFAADEIALLEQGSGATVALNLMEFMRQLLAKSRPAIAGAAGR